MLFAGVLPVAASYSVQHGELITLTFDANAPDWDATATLRGDSLSVQYNFDMVMSDFIDGVYVRSPVTP